MNRNELRHFYVCTLLSVIIFSGGSFIDTLTHILGRNNKLSRVIKYSEWDEECAPCTFHFFFVKGTTTSSLS